MNVLYNVIVHQVGNLPKAWKFCSWVILGSSVFESRVVACGYWKDDFKS